MMTSPTDSTDELLYRHEGSVGIITFNRPAARNALTFAMYEQLAEICSAICESTDKATALIITGAGDKAFAAGTDISNFRGFRTPEDALGYERTMDRVLGLLESVPVPSIAAIRGACTGGGAAIAACCDLRYSSQDLKYGFPIARTLGNCLSITNLSRLVYLLGAARTREIILTSRLILIDEAVSINLITEVHADPLARAMEMAKQMAEYAPLTISATKTGLRRLRENTADVHDDDLIIQCYTSNDFREGMDAFLARRKPDWNGN